MAGVFAVVIVADALCAGPALLGPSAAPVDPAPALSASGSGIGLWLTTGILLCLCAAAGWAIWRWRLFWLPPIGEANRPADWPVLLVVGLVVLLSQPIGAGTAFAVFALTPEQRASLPGVALGAVGGYLTAFCALIGAGFLLPGLIKRLGAGWRGRDCVWGLVGIALAAPMVVFLGQIALALAGLIARWSGSVPPQANAHATLRLLVGDETWSSGWWWALVAAVVIGAPIVEEVVYRGLLQSACRAATGSRWWAVLIASGVFVLMHASVAEAHALVVLFALSLAFGVAYERTGRLWVPITMHAVFNAGNLLGALMFGPGGG